MAVLVQPMVDARLGRRALRRRPRHRSPRPLRRRRGRRRPVRPRVRRGERLDRGARPARPRRRERDPRPRRLRRRLRCCARWRSSPPTSPRPSVGRRTSSGPSTHGGTLWLLQARPITALAPRRGTVLGPGPVAETFPEPLAQLEQDLWLDPLREGLREALRLAGTSSTKALERSPLAVAVDGSAAVDLDLLGVDPAPGGFLRKLDPRPPARRLRAAWRVGRLRASFADLGRRRRAAGRRRPPRRARARRSSPTTSCSRCCATASASSRACTATRRSPGSSCPTPTPPASPARRWPCRPWPRPAPRASRCATSSSAIPSCWRSCRRASGPSRCSTASTASTSPRRTTAADVEPDATAVAREALRLRVRWVQELTGRAAWELGRRLVDVGDPAVARRHPPAHPRRAHRRGPAPHGAGRSPRAASSPPVGSCPTRFRLDRRRLTGRSGAGSTQPGPGRRGRVDDDAAVAASGGVATGPVHLGENPPAGACSSCVTSTRGWRR